MDRKITLAGLWRLCIPGQETHCWVRLSRKLNGNENEWCLAYRASHIAKASQSDLHLQYRVYTYTVKMRIYREKGKCNMHEPLSCVLPPCRHINSRREKWTTYFLSEFSCRVPNRMCPTEKVLYYLDCATIVWYFRIIEY